MLARRFLYRIFPEAESLNLLQSLDCTGKQNTPLERRNRKDGSSVRGRRGCGHLHPARLVCSVGSGHWESRLGS